jgi:hypothetical protein
MTTPLHEVNAEALAWWKEHSAERGVILRGYLERGVSGVELAHLTKTLSKSRKAAFNIFIRYSFSQPVYIPISDLRFVPAKKSVWVWLKESLQTYPSRSGSGGGTGGGTGGVFAPGMTRRA